MKHVFRTFGLVSIAFLFLNVSNVFAQAKTLNGVFDDLQEFHVVQLAVDSLDSQFSELYEYGMRNIGVYSIEKKGMKQEIQERLQGINETIEFPDAELMMNIKEEDSYVRIFYDKKDTGHINNLYFLVDTEDNYVALKISGVMLMENIKKLISENTGQNSGKDFIKLGN
ncbi:DUF4252 domain-containing protein [Porphyromonas macacae]|nr:DUF4252 domain-containing protein [Porphyromonas macacae]